MSGRAWVGYEGTVGHSRKRQLVKTKSTSRSPNSAAEKVAVVCGNLRLRVLGVRVDVDVGDEGKAPLIASAGGGVIARSQDILIKAWAKSP